MRQGSSIGLLALSGLLAVQPIDSSSIDRRKPKRRLKPSGQPIPEGTMTRQRRRAEARQARKETPA